MRRLRRAREKARRSSEVKRCILATSTVAALGLLPQVARAESLQTPLADKHQIAVAKDADKDLLNDREEWALGYDLLQPDQNHSGIADGAELAMRCAAAIAQLPLRTETADERKPFKEELFVFGLETCDVCGEAVNMGAVRVVNPTLGLAVELPILATHYMAHGSFSYAGEINKGRVEIATLARTLGIRFPCEPNEHQLPLTMKIDSGQQIAPDANDLDGDLLADTEELAAGFGLYDTDQDRDLLPDGIHLARRCAEIIDRLPTVEPNAPEAKGVYKISYMMRGLEWCEICSQSVNMGYWEIVDAASGQSMQVSEIARHFMEHGSFSYMGTVHGAKRTDVAALLEILGWPVKCGDLGTTYLPGDLNKDCNVDAKDLVELARQWLASTDPADK
jgi:hypothetical protein